MISASWAAVVCAAVISGDVRTDQSTSDASVDKNIVLVGNTTVVADPCCDPCKGKRKTLLGLFKHKSACCEPVAACCEPVKDACCDPCAPRCRRTLVDRLRELFCKKKCDPCCDPCCGDAVVSCVTVDDKKAADLASIPTEVKKETVVRKPVAPPQPGHADDYSWVQGRLHYAHVNGGAWVVRYMPLDRVDKYGGSMVLTRDARLADYKEGQMVRVSGEILSEHASVYLGGPLYRVDGLKSLNAESTDVALK